LQCVAVCCSVLQCVAVCCRVLQCDAVCCSVLQCVLSAYAIRLASLKEPSCRRGVNQSAHTQKPGNVRVLAAWKILETGSFTHYDAQRA